MKPWVKICTTSVAPARCCCREGGSFLWSVFSSSLQLFSCDESPPSAPAPLQQREPSCRKACGGYNELGVYPGFPDLRPMTSSINEVLLLSETLGPNLDRLARSLPASRGQGATDFHLFLFVFIIPPCSSSADVFGRCTRLCL